MGRDCTHGVHYWVALSSAVVTRPNWRTGRENKELCVSGAARGKGWVYGQAIDHSYLALVAFSRCRGRQGLKSSSKDIIE